MAPGTVRIVIPSRDWGSGSPMDLQEPLDAALGEAGLGEIVRGGAGPGEFFLEAEVTDESAALALIRRVLEDEKAPSSSRVEPGSSADASRRSE